jgi:hypothetical protein
MIRDFLNYLRFFLWTTWCLIREETIAFLLRSSRQLLLASHSNSSEQGQVTQSTRDNLTDGDDEDDNDDDEEGAVTSDDIEFAATSLVFFLPGMIKHFLSSVIHF